ncbi:UNVERIFIED_CONTAM: hypothetical protein HHA_238077 [Hammondia hammondi]|eukprot:XP_008887566.1 hypothetical protein HHA_238077 [Hammondia hammondi]
MPTSAARQRTVNVSPLPTVRERRPLSCFARPRPCSRSPSSGPSRSLPSSLPGAVSSSLKMSSSGTSMRLREVEELSPLPTRLCVSSSREMQTHRSREGLFPPAVQTGGASPAEDAGSSLCLSSSLSSAVASPVSPASEKTSARSVSSFGFSAPLSPLHSPAEEETTAALPPVATREERCVSAEAKKVSEKRESTRVQEQGEEQPDARAEGEVRPFSRNSTDASSFFLSSSLNREKTGDSSASAHEALLKRLQGHLRFLSSFSTTQQLPPSSALSNAKKQHAERRTSSPTRTSSREKTSKDSSKFQTKQRSTPEHAQTKKTHLRQPSSARSTTSRHPSLPSSPPPSPSSSSSRQSTSLPSSRHSGPSSVIRSPGGQSTVRDTGSAACPPQRSNEASSLRRQRTCPRRRLQMSATLGNLRGEEEWRREAGTERNGEETERDAGERKPLTGREDEREGQEDREERKDTERGASGVDTASKSLAEKEQAHKGGDMKSSVLDKLESEVEKGVFTADLVIAATAEEPGEEGAKQKNGFFKDTEEARAHSRRASTLARQPKKTQPAQREETVREKVGEEEREEEREGRAGANAGTGRRSVSGDGMESAREATKWTLEQERNAKLLEDLCVKFAANKLLQMRRSRAVVFSREESEGATCPTDLPSRAKRTSRGDPRSTANEAKQRGVKENRSRGVTEEAQEHEEVKGRFTETCSSIRLRPSSTSQQPRKTRGSFPSSRSSSRSPCVRSACSFSDQQPELPTLLSRVRGPSLEKAEAARKANRETGQSGKGCEEESAQAAEERLPGQGVGTTCLSSVRSTKRIEETPFSASSTSRVSLPASEKSGCRFPACPHSSLHSPAKLPLSSRSRHRHVILLTPLPSPLPSSFPSPCTSSSSAFPSAALARPPEARRATRRECTDARRSFRRGEGEEDFEKMRETREARRERRENRARLTDLRRKEEGVFTASQDKHRTWKSRKPSANASAASHLHEEQSPRLLRCPKTLQPRSSSTSPRDGTPSLHKGKTEGFGSPRTLPCSSSPLHSHLPVASCSRCSSQPFQHSCLPVYSASLPLPSFVPPSPLLYAPPLSSHFPSSSPQLSSSRPSSSSSRPSSLFPQAFAPAECTPAFLCSSDRPVSRLHASSLFLPTERRSASPEREAKESRRLLHLAEAEKESSRLRSPERAKEARDQGAFEQRRRWEASCPSLPLLRRGRWKETPRGREETTQRPLRVMDSREEGLRLRMQREFDRLPRRHAASSTEQRRCRELGEIGCAVEPAVPPRPRRNISEEFTKQERRTRQVNLQETEGTETLERMRVNTGETSTPFSDFSAPPELWNVALRVSPSFPSPFFSFSFPSSPFFALPSSQNCGKVLQTARGQAGSCESLRSLWAAEGFEEEQNSREETGDACGGKPKECEQTNRRNEKKNSNLPLHATTSFSQNSVSQYVYQTHR